MITDSTIEAFNSRLTVNINSIKTMTPAELDRVRAQGSNAEALLKNKDLALFIHHFKFDVADQLSSLSGHSPDDNARRIALSNELRGIDQFVSTLQRAVYMKNKVVTQQQDGPRDEPADILHREYQ